MNNEDVAGIVEITVRITERVSILPTTGADPTMLIALGIAALVAGIAITIATLSSVRQRWARAEMPSGGL